MNKTSEDQAIKERPMREGHGIAVAMRTTLLIWMLLAALPLASAADGGRPLELTTQADGTVQGQGGRYALIIGIDDYCDELNAEGLSDLRYCAKGATEIRDALVQYGGFPERNVRLLLNSEATQEEILQYLDLLRLPEKFPQGDTFLLYFSGHGGIIDSRSDTANAQGQRDNYLIPYDGNATAILAEKRNVRMDDVLQCLDRAAGFKRKIVLLDACRNVQRTDGAKGLGNRSGFDFSAYNSFAQGLKVLSGCKYGEQSWEDDPLQSGVFTHYVVEGLRGGASNEDGVVTLDSLASYVGAYLAEWSRENPGKAMTPEVYGAGIGAMPLTLVRPPDVLTPRQAAEKLQTQGLALEDAGRLDEALGAYQQAARTDPSWAWPRFATGNIYLDQQRYDEAIAEYKEAIRLDPQYAYPHNNLGSVYDDQKRYDEAIAEYKETIRLDPQCSYPHNGLGIVYDDLGRYDEAAAEYKEAVRLDPQYAFARNNLGNVYETLQRYDEAIAEFKEAIRLDPQYAYPHNGLGIVYYDLGRYDEAIAEYKAALRLDPDFESAKNNLKLAEALTPAQAYRDYTASSYGFQIKLPITGTVNDPSSEGWAVEPEVAFEWYGGENDPVITIQARVDDLGTPIDSDTFMASCDALLEYWSNDTANYSVLTANESVRIGETTWNLIEIADSSDKDTKVYYSVFSTYRGTKTYVIAFYYAQPFDEVMWDFCKRVLDGFRADAD
jgi:tetratricopeptide (TPR) repeat protein